MSNSHFTLKITCVVLSLVMLLTMFVGCGNNVSNTNETTEDNAETQEVVNAPVKHYVWKGRDFNILTTQNEYEPNFEVVGVEGEAISSKVCERNDWIEEYYDVVIHDVGAKGNDNKQLIANGINSGDYLYDLVFLQRSDMSSAIQSGYMYNILNIQNSFIDLTNEWYNKTTIESMKVGNTLFHMVSDYSLVDKARTNVLYLNRDLATNRGLPDIFELVRNKEWTIDKMTEYAVASEIDGIDGTGLEDEWGLINAGKEGITVFWNALGNKLVTTSEDGWSIEVASEHSINSVDKLRLLFNEDNFFYGDKLTPKDYSTPTTIFTAGRALFLSSSLSGITSLAAKTTFSYSPVPYPMYDKNQGEYYTTNDNVYCSTYGISKCTNDVVFSTFMIEVLSWKSSTTTYPYYIETICKLQKSYDAVCSEMVTLVLKGLTFDFGLLYSAGLRSEVLYTGIYDKQDVATTYKGIKESKEAKVEQIFNNIEFYQDQ